MRRLRHLADRARRRAPGQVRLVGKGDQVRVVPLPVRGRKRVSASRYFRAGRAEQAAVVERVFE